MVGRQVSMLIWHQWGKSQYPIEQALSRSEKFGSHLGWGLAGRVFSAPRVVKVGVKVVFEQIGAQARAQHWKP